MINQIINIFNKLQIKKISKEKNIKNIFSKIYNKNYWGDNESVSGPGSNSLNTKNVINSLKKIIIQYKIKFIVDAPCGDFFWINKVLKKVKVKYLGLDIVEKLIFENKKKYSTNLIKFENFNLIKKKIPNCDMIICRDFIFHLSYSDIKKFFYNLSRSEFKYILISNHENGKGSKNLFMNKDIFSGDFRKINLFSSPFNFPKNYEFFIKDFCNGKKKYLIFFTKRQIQLAIKNYLK